MPEKIVSIRFRLPNEDQSISTEDARWLLGLVLASRELTAEAAALAERIEQALLKGSAVETFAPEEQHVLIDALERGSTNLGPQTSAGSKLASTPLSIRRPT